MRSLSTQWSLPIVAAFALTSITPLVTRAQSTTLPPARTYHIDQYGQQTKVVKERWSDNANGEKQGIYLLYNAQGLPTTKYTYTNGVKNGPAFLVGEDYFYSISFRLTVKFSGSFLNGKEEGWWDVYQVGFDGSTGALDRRMKYASGKLEYVTTFRDGKMTAIYKYEGGNKNGLARLYGPTREEYATGQYRDGQRVDIWRDAGIKFNGGDAVLVYRKGGSVSFDKGEPNSITDPNGTTRTLAELAQQRAAAAATVVEQQALRKEAENNFYTYSLADQQFFQQMRFNLAAGGQATGKELLGSQAFQPTTYAQLVAANATNSSAVAALLKQAKAMHLEPVQLLMRDASLPRAAFMAVLDQHNALLDAEMLYYGMRGVEAEKGHGTSAYVMNILSARRSEFQNYKQLVERYFNHTSAAAKDAYSNTHAYPLRRWIYEEYNRFEPDPLKWMNMLTASNPQEDQVNFPRLYGN